MLLSFLDHGPSIRPNPYVDDPKAHFAFAPPVDGKGVGTISGTTERGRKTVEICRLSRDELNNSRASAQETTIALLGIAIIKGNVGNIRAQLEAGDDDFSAARLSTAKAWIEQLKDQWGT